MFIPGEVFNEDMNSWVHYNDSSVSFKTIVLVNRKVKI